MQLKNLLILALASAVIAQDSDDDGVWDEIEDFNDDVQSVWNAAVSKGSGFWSSVGAEASAVAASYEAEISRFTATATPGPAAAAYIASLEDAAEAALYSISTRIRYGEAAATPTGPASGSNTPTPTGSLTASKTYPTGATNTNPASGAGRMAFSVSAIGVALLGGAMVFL
ncbi:hypothetical protein QTJ16_005136 [Diplocarpon rosae]|uniref:Uncharacterized protein n=1 Tax=Diplocarpon rosae TaxID=946125 RepID=A0AAD9SZI6_9HELO|nr:hypothetical protein QTJ16_005136 [Diplocarpon rosae]PBP21461.1 hypothetical protein BUE80_DR007721 [Diplocarpon rosae]